MSDNVVACKARLRDYTLQSILDAHRDSGNELDMLVTLRTVNAILDNNIQCHDALTFDYEGWKPYEV